MIDRYASERAVLAIMRVLHSRHFAWDVAESEARGIVAAGDAGSGVALARYSQATAHAVIRAYANAIAEHARVIVGMARGVEGRAAAEAQARELRAHAIAIETALPVWQRHISREAA